MMRNHSLYNVRLISPIGKEGETNLSGLCLCNFLEAQKDFQGTCLWRLASVFCCASKLF